MAGIGLKLASVFFFSSMLAISKRYTEYPLTVIVFYRSFFALLVLIGWLAWRGAFPRALYTKRLPAHLVRSFAGIGSMFCIFGAYALMPMADATAIGYIQPLLVAALAGVILGERVTPLRIGAIACGFAGVLVMLWSHLGGAGPANPDRLLGAGLAIAGALLVAIAFIQIRRLTETEDTGAIAFYFQFCTTVAAMLVMGAALLWPRGWWAADWIRAQAWIWPSLADAGPLICIGLFGGIGQIAMTQAFKWTDASILAVFDYSSLIWAVIFGVLLFGDWPTLNILAGAALVVAAGLAVVWQEGRARSAHQGTAAKI